MKVQSDNDDEEHKSGSGTTSNDSADDYFNQQRQLIRNKLTASSVATSLFSKEDLLEPVIPEPTQEDRRWGMDDDMQDFDRLMNDSVREAERL